MNSSDKKLVTLLLGCLLACNASAQNREEILKQGEQVYAVTCATGYCHTLNGGIGGGAPRLAARGFDLDYITRTVTSGVRETRMEGFAARLPDNELQAVITYVASLNGIYTVGQAITPALLRVKPVLSPDAMKGKQLLHDSLRAFNRCATCHQVEGSGVPVAEPLSEIPDSAGRLRRLETPTVSTVTVAGDSMPALVLRQGARRTVFFDLTSTPPVRRNVDSSRIEISAGSNWRHSSAITTYSDAELDSILAYLRAVTKID